VHAGKLEQVSNFSTVSGTAKHNLDRYMVLFCYCSLGGDTAMPGWLHARLCHAFLVSPVMETKDNAKCIKLDDLGG